jgi:hypothetical protein
VAALDVIGILLLVGCVFLVAFVVRRRLLIRSGGTIEMSWRLRHWTFGVARYDQDVVVWFPTFSLRPKPRRILTRSSTHITARRVPHGAEVWALVPDAVVLECRSSHGPAEIAIPSTALLGFLSWLEAGHRTPSREWPTVAR